MTPRPLYLSGKYSSMCSVECILSTRTSSFSYVLCELDASGSGEDKKGVRVNEVRKSLVIMKNEKFLEQRQLTSEEGLCCRHFGFALVFLQFLAFLLGLFFLANILACNYLSFFVNEYVLYK
jgi:hypothetical protein